VENMKIMVFWDVMLHSLLKAIFRVEKQAKQETAKKQTEMVCSSKMSDFL
jgi:hypothetical protein